MTNVGGATNTVLFFLDKAPVESVRNRLDLD